MRRLAVGEEAEEEPEAVAPLRYWSASMVRRLPNEAGGLRTETLEEDARIREFLSTAELQSADDLERRAEGWTFVVNQLQGSARELQDLQHRLLCHTGLCGGVNAYLTPPGAIGKPPHIDDHDVIVLQLAGEKLWTLLAERLLALVKAGPRPVPGDAPGLAQRRALRQASAAASAGALAELAARGAVALAPLALQAVWMRREILADQHFSRVGPRPPGRSSTADGPPAACWRPSSAPIFALQRPGGALRVNGRRLKASSDVAKAALRASARGAAVVGVYDGGAVRHTMLALERAGAVERICS